MRCAGRVRLSFVMALGIGLMPAGAARAGWPFRKPGGRRVVVMNPANATARPPGGMLGSFYPDPMINIAGNGYLSGGYSPLDMYGPNTLSLDGPLSPFRAESAPVVTYERGYDGMTRARVSTSYSYPNRPDLAPLVYPTRANYYWGFGGSRTPPQWDRAVNWLDQN